MYPRRWGWTVFPGRHEKSGSSERRQFTFVTTPVALMARTFPRNVGSTTSGSRSRVNVVFTSTFARTAPAPPPGPAGRPPPPAPPAPAARGGWGPPPRAGGGRPRRPPGGGGGGGPPPAGGGPRRILT